MNDAKYERIVAADPIGATWLRLKRLTSKRLCEQAITERNSVSIAPDVLAQKASGMAWAIRSGLGYWETQAAGLNSRVLSRYYAVLQLSIAEQVSSSDPKDLLPAIQRHTEFGHGLFTLRDPNMQFPDGLWIGSAQSGHFAAYAKYRKLDLKPYIFEKKPKKLSELDEATQARLISLTDLLRRVPELQSVTNEFLGKEPLSFHIGHDNLKNMETRRANRPSRSALLGAQATQDVEDAEVTTWMNIYPSRSGGPMPDISGHGFPFTDITEQGDSFGAGRHLSVAFKHPSDGHWYKHLRTYKSAYCGTSLIAPIWGTDDPFVLHFAILYAFSIVVRYLPELWHEIEDGDLDHIRALLEQYLTIVDHVLPKLIIERLTGITLHVVQPDSLNAPI